MKNKITDIAGIHVGNADDASLASGVTAIVFDRPAVAAIDVRGGGPGTRESDALGFAGTVETIHGLALSGGSAFGLDAAGGVMAWLAEQGRGFPVGSALVPIVPGAIVFDLLNGGNKNWGAFRPIATSPIRRPPPHPRTSHSAVPARASARPPPT
jgi:D-aminopeptidase